MLVESGIRGLFLLVARASRFIASAFCAGSSLQDNEDDSTCLSALLTLPVTQDPTRPPQIIDPPPKFDEWTSLPLRDEKTRLDNLAIHWHQSPRLVIHIVIYAGKQACDGEAEARWVRMRDWLVRKRRVPADKITWADGGYREEPTVTCWLWPPELGKAPEPVDTLKRSEIKVIKGCRIFSQ